MRDSPVSTIIFLVIWTLAGLVAIIAVPAVLHHAYGGSYLGGLVYLTPAITAIGYSIWKKRRDKTEPQKLP
jgi:drug/metabolite transporter (DMT)-like permease